MNDGSRKKFQVILIAKIENGKIARIDEMTDPRWEKKLDITEKTTN